MSKNPGVSVVIPAYNESKMIKPCLEACFRQTVPFEQIIVVNNLSTDNTEEIVRELQADHPELVLLQQSEAQGITPTRDAGFNAVKSEVIGRIDADSIVDENWVESVSKAFTDESVAATTGPVFYYDMPMLKLGSTVDKKIRSVLHNSAKDHSFLFGTNMAIRNRAWQSIRDQIAPDPDNEQHEDISIALALFQDGHKITYTSDMLAGMSARRVDDDPKSFYRYVWRYENTFRAYGIKSASARIPMFIYLLIYFPVRMIRRFYDSEQNSFTLNKLRDDIAQLRAKFGRKQSE